MKQKTYIKFITSGISRVIIPETAFLLIIRIEKIAVISFQDFPSNNV